MNVKNAFLKLFFVDANSPIEREVRKRFSWRLIMLTLSPLPLVLLLIYVLYCYVQMRFFTLEYLQSRYVDVESRLHALEQRMDEEHGVGNIRGRETSAEKGGSSMP